MKKPNLVISGSIAVDRIMNFGGKYRDLIQEDKLHVLSVSVLLEKLEETNGGTGANIAYNYALLGGEPTLLGSIGNNTTQYLNDLESAGINTDHVHVSETATATFNVITDTEDNQVGGFYPGAMSDSDTLTFESWDDDVFVCVSAHDPAAMKRQVQECKTRGLRLMYDPGQQVSNVPDEDLKEGVDAAEVVIVNDYELSLLAKKTGYSEQEITAEVPIVITTLGGEGSRIEGSKVEGAITVPAGKPSQVVDPTGAGDAFRAGFLYGYLREWDLEKSGKLGSVLGVLNVERHGTQHDITDKDVLDRYEKEFNERITL